MKKININNIASNYLIQVIGNELRYLVKTEKGWVTKLKTTCNVGKNGFKENRKSGDMTTPIGLFKVLYAFGTEYIKTSLKYKAITPYSYFSDDENSDYYNSWVESEIPINGEHLIDYPTEYHYGLVFDFNMSPKVKGNGSSIFLHCIGNHDYTAGCIAISEMDMVKLLGVLDCETYILIVPNKDYIEM